MIILFFCCTDYKQQTLATWADKWHRRKMTNIYNEKWETMGIPLFTKYDKHTLYLNIWFPHNKTSIQLSKERGIMHVTCYTDILGYWQKYIGCMYECHDEFIITSFFDISMNSIVWNWIPCSIYWSIILVSTRRLLLILCVIRKPS